MEIHVALAFGAVIAGTALLGIVGALLSLPVAATAQAFTTSWLDRRDANNSEQAETEGAAEQPDNEA